MPRAKRRLGQHFLADPGILARIADALEAAPGDSILEIGPGPGGLTAALLARAGRVVAIEKDSDLIEPLSTRFPTLELVHGDALDIDWHGLMGGSFLLAGNIPYNITSPLLDKALTPPVPRRIVFLVQKEVADRVTAPAGAGAYGALSVGIQAVARPERLFTVPAGAFHPRPKVDSALVRIRRLPEPAVGGDPELLFKLVRAGFGQRRKMLRRSLVELATPEAFVAAGVDPEARAEELDLPAWARLADAVRRSPAEDE